MTPLFSGELQLAGWSETHNGGCKVTFWLQSSDDLEAFRTLTIRKGNTSGQRFMAALVEVGDDELPVQPIDTLPEPVQKAAENVHIGGPLARLAGQWCADPAFREWIYVDTEAQAAEKIRAFCNIESRRLLDHDLEAATKFKKLFRTPYMAHIKDGAL